MSSTSDTPIVRNVAPPETPVPRPDRVAYRAPTSVIVPSGKPVTSLSDSDAFEIVFGESIDLDARAVRFWTADPLPSSHVIVQFDWPDRGPVTLEVLAVPEPSTPSRYVYDAEIRDVL